MRGLLLLLSLLATAAGAVQLDSGRDAQVLIYPLFSTRGDHETELTVRNLAAAGKALRLVLRDATDGRPTLSINIYLRGGDVWSGRLSGQNEGFTTLFSSDESCTFPALGNGPDSGLTNSAAFLAQPSQPARLPRNRLNTGYAEIYEMGELDGELAADCQAVDERWTSGIWSGDPGADQNDQINAPGGQLTGTAFIKNTRTGASFVLDPAALADFRDAPLHTHPANITRPGLADVNPAVTVRRQTVQLTQSAIEILYRRSFSANPIAAVEAALMTTGLAGEVHSSAAAGVNASLLVVLPTRPYQRDGAFYGVNASSGLLADNPLLVGSVAETDGDQRDLTQPPGASACDELNAVVNSVALPNFFNFDHLCALGESELFVPNNSTRSFLTLSFSGQLVADDGTVFSGLPAIGHVLQSTRGSTAAGGAGEFARPLRRP